MWLWSWYWKTAKLEELQQHIRMDLLDLTTFWQMSYFEWLHKLTLHAQLSVAQSGQWLEFIKRRRKSLSKSKFFSRLRCSCFESVCVLMWTTIWIFSTGWWHQCLQMECMFLCMSVCVYHQESSQGFIRVQAPQFNKVSMAVELTADLQAADVLTRFLSQER